MTSIRTLTRHAWADREARGGFAAALFCAAAAVVSATRGWSPAWTVTAAVLTGMYTALGVWLAVEAGRKPAADTPTRAG